MFSKFLAASFAVTALIGGGSALADGPAHPNNNESGTTYHGAQYQRVDGALARVDFWNARSSALTAAGPSEYEFLGEEAGWQLRQHSFGVSKGRLVHTDNIAHDTARPKFIAEAPSARSRNLDSGR